MTDLATREPTDRLGSPIHPPRHWFFETPEWVDPGENGIAVQLDGPEVGRAAGYCWDWETCWINSTSGKCEPFTPSPTGLEVYYSGGAEVLCDDGTKVNVGVVPYRGGHSPLDLNEWESREYYDNPAYQGLVGRIVEDDIGGLFLGAVVPHLNVEDSALIARSKVSGHMVWRLGMKDPDTGHPIRNGYDQVGPTIVSTGAIPRASHGYARVAGLDPAHPVLIGPYFDPALQEEILMLCPRCELDHAETTACSTARAAAVHDDDDDDGLPDPGTHHDGAGPDVGQSGRAKDPSAMPLTVDVRQIVIDQQAVAAQLVAMAATVEQQSGTIVAQGERIEELSGVIVEIEQRLNDQEFVVLDESGEERLDRVERVTTEIRDSASAPTPSATEDRVTAGA